MSPDEVVAAIDALDADDPEMAHYDADELVLELAPREVRAAYDRLIARCRWWAHA